VRRERRPCPVCGLPGYSYVRQETWHDDLYWIHVSRDEKGERHFRWCLVKHDVGEEAEKP